MVDYPTTWWTRTDKMTPFDRDGVSSPIYRNNETGEERSELPTGALYICERGPRAEPDDWPPAGPDGLSVICKTIDGWWYIDSRASNCTKPDDRKHRCWCRHGTIGDKLTVDKNGNTCAAGAGSFYMDEKRWHGFLADGVLVQR